MFRLSKSKAFLQNNLTLLFISSFDKEKKPLDVEDSQRTKVFQKIIEVIQIMSFIVGNLNVDCEIILAEFTASHLRLDDELAFFFMDSLFTFLDNMKDNLC